MVDVHGVHLRGHSSGMEPTTFLHQGGEGGREGEREGGGRRKERELSEGSRIQ